MFSNKDKKLEEELSNSNNSIGKGTRIEGDTTSYGNIRIDGEVKGNVITKSKLVIGEGALVEGNVIAQNAEVAGEIKGVIEVAELLILKPSGLINGDIITNRLVVESGAAFNGACKMGAVIKEIQIDSGAHPTKEEAKERTA